MTITATCPHCGTTVTAENEDAVVKSAQEHMQNAHGFAPAMSRKHILARLRQQKHKSSEQQS